MLAKDVENDGRAVDDLNLDRVLERASLARGELRVGYHGVGTHSQHEVAQLGHLAASEIGGRIGIRATLENTVEHLRAGGLTEGCQLAQAVLGIRRGALRIDTDEHHLFESQLAILNLGDVLEFGGESGDPLERLAIGEVELVAITRRGEAGVVLSDSCGTT